MISKLYDLLVFLPSLFYWLGGFLLIDLLSGFPPQSFIISLEGFSLMTSLFETHQLLYRARIFSVVSRFSFLVSFIRLKDFLSGFHSFLQQFLRSADLTSKERNNCNNMTIGAESSQSGSHMIKIIQNFTLVNLTSTTRPYPARLLFGATVPSHSMHLITYLTPHCLRSWKVFPAIGTMCILSIYQGMRLSFLKRYWIA